MPIVELTAGQNAALPPAATLTVRVAAATGHADAIALLRDGGGRADGDDGVVLFSNPVAGQGAVRLDQADDTVTVELSRLPAAVESVLVVAQADGAPTLAGTGTLTAKVSADGAPAFTFALPAPGIATLQLIELYRRGGGWKVRALGDGYAEGLAKLLTVHGIEVNDEPAAAPAPAPIDLQKRRVVDLRKQVAASRGGVSLVKAFDAAAVSLSKKGLLGERARVVLCLDVSGSARGLMKDGRYQSLVERCLVAGLLFDDDGEVETWLFDHTVRAGEPVNLDNAEGWCDRARATKGIWGGTKYAEAMRWAARGVQRGDATPTFVFFVTDGGNADHRPTTEALVELAHLPVFFLYAAVGRDQDFPFLQRLDDLRVGAGPKDREVDNADFFAFRDPAAVADGDYMDRVLNEFPSWLARARELGIVGRA